MSWIQGVGYGQRTQGLGDLRYAIIVQPPVVVEPLVLTQPGQLAGVIQGRTGELRVSDRVAIEAIGFTIVTELEKAGQVDFLVVGTLQQVLVLGKRKLCYPNVFWNLAPNKPLAEHTIYMSRPGATRPRPPEWGHENFIYADFPDP